MNDQYEFLVEKEEMWAKMLMEVLKDNDIPCTALPRYGAGLTMKAGVKERLQVFVSSDCKSKAEELLNALFPKDAE